MYGSFIFWPAFTTTLPSWGFILDYCKRYRVLERSHLWRTFSKCLALSSSCPFLRFFRYPDDLSSPNFWLRARARKAANSSCRETSCGVLASPINRNKLKKGGQTKLPLFTCTRRRLRSRIGDRKRRKGAPQFCTTCVGNERAEKHAAKASRKLISPE